MKITLKEQERARICEEGTEDRMQLTLSGAETSAWEATGETW